MSSKSGPPSLFGLWLSTPRNAAAAEFNCLTAIKAHKTLRDYVQQNPLLGLAISKEGDAEKAEKAGTGAPAKSPVIRIRRLSGVLPGFPPARITTNWGVMYSEAGRQWARILMFDEPAMVLTLERVGPASTFPRIVESYRAVHDAQEGLMLIRNVEITDKHQRTMSMVLQRFRKAVDSRAIPKDVAIKVSASTFVESAATIEKEHGAVLGQPVLILDAQGAPEKECPGQAQCRLLRCGIDSPGPQFFKIGVVLPGGATAVVVHRYQDFRRLYDILCWEMDCHGEDPRKVFGNFPPRMMYRAQGRALCTRQSELQDFLSDAMKPSWAGALAAQMAIRDFLTPRAANRDKEYTLCLEKSQFGRSFMDRRFSASL